MAEHIILLHGIWMRGLTLVSLARSLRRAGYSVEALDYASVFGGVRDAAKRLRARVQARAPATVHLVGHSLGGLVALEASRDLPASDGRVVCLGSPLRGSAVARRLTRSPGGRWLLGHSREALLGGVADWRGGRSVGVIAGTRPIGIGIALGALPASTNDGTVSIEETQLPGIADHCVVPVTHSGLVYSAEVAARIVDFLRDGHFAPATRS